MTLTCDRALAVLTALRSGVLDVKAQEIEELLAAGLAVEADPEDLALVQWIEATCQQLVRHPCTAPAAPAELRDILRQADEDLSSDWYRMTTGRPELARREQERVTLRRALGYLRDPGILALIARLSRQSSVLASGARYVACPALGIEVYAVTGKGGAVARAIQPRLARFAGTPLKSFLASWAKVDAKMQAFADEIQAIDRGIGHVKKNRHQIVIGLAKTGLPSPKALHVYRSAHGQTASPFDAVTVARNAAQLGGPTQAAQRLQAAENALRHAGFPMTQLVIGTAKSLLLFEPLEKGLHRYVALKRALDRQLGLAEQNFKYTARLMSATGEPNEIVQRVAFAADALQRQRGLQRGDDTAAAVAIAAMVRSPGQIAEAVGRLRDLAYRLVTAELASGDNATDLALECLACPGAPEEVVATVRSLAFHVSRGGERNPGDTAIAVAFAKRFAL